MVTPALASNNSGLGLLPGRGWLLDDGSYLHAEGATVHDDVSDDEVILTLLDRRHAIRVMESYCFELYGIPSSDQRQEMARLVKESGQGLVIWDIHHAKGKKKDLTGDGTLGQFLRAVDKAYAEPHKSRTAHWLLVADSPQLSPHRYTEYPQSSNGYALQPDRRKGDSGAGGTNVNESGAGQVLPGIDKLLENGEAVDGAYDLGVGHSGRSTTRTGHWLLKLEAAEKNRREGQVIEAYPGRWYYTISDPSVPFRDIAGMAEFAFHGPFESDVAAVAALRRDRFYPGFGFLTWYHHVLTPETLEALAELTKHAVPPQMEMFAAQDVPGVTYLIHTLRPLAHLRHYLGWTQNLEQRLEEHRSGRGARVMQVLKEQGIEWELARTWPNTTRKFERKLKSQGGLSRHCPICEEQGLICPSREVAKALQTTEGTDYVETCEVKKAGTYYPPVMDFKFPLTVYRAMHAFHPNTVRTRDFGMSWTWNEDKAKSYGSQESFDTGDVQDYSNDLIFRGVIEEDAIDWDATEKVNRHPQFVPEDEVVLRHGAEVELTGYRKATGSKWMPVPRRLRAVTATRRYSAQRVAEYFLSLNPTRDEFALHDIMQYPAWELREMPTVGMGCKLSPGDEPYLSVEYAKLKTPFPPVILDGNGHLIDGMHRCEAAGLRGDKTIWAYVPVARKNASKIGGVEFLPRCWATKSFTEGFADMTKFASWLLLGADYKKMFESLLRLAPRLKPDVNREIEWAKTTLEKNDRIVWYLRWVRLWYEDGIANGELAGFTVSEDDARKQQAKALLDKDIAAYNAKSTKVKISEQDVQHFTLRDLKRQLEHFFALEDHEIDSFQLGYETPVQAIEQLEEIEDRVRERVETEKRVVKEPTQPGDKPFIKFGDGWVWWWLDRAYCPEEARSMGHCGNEPRSKSSDRILSLRQPIVKAGKTWWSPHLTFIMDERGFLGEMKGRGNDKPALKYHPYIVSLLKDNRVKGTKGATWFKENNFKLSDLTDEQRQEIYAANPAFADPAKYWREHGKDAAKVAQIAERLDIDTDTYRPEWDAFVIRQWDDIGDCLSSIGSGAIGEAYEWATMTDEQRQRRTQEGWGHASLDNPESVADEIVKECKDETVRGMVETLRREVPGLLDDFKAEMGAAQARYTGRTEWGWNDLDDDSAADLLYYVERRAGTDTSVWANIKTAFETATTNNHNWMRVSDLEYELTSGMYERVEDGAVNTELRFGDNDHFSWDAKPVYEIIEYDKAAELANPENNYSEKDRDLSSGSKLEVYISEDSHDDSDESEYSDSPYVILDAMYSGKMKQDEDERQLHLFRENRPPQPELTEEEEEAADDAALAEAAPAGALGQG